MAASSSMVQLGLVNGLTDARCFFDCGKPIAVIGVCGRDSHGADEAVRLSSVDAVADLLVKFLSR